jgi:MFS family permease
MRVERSGFRGRWHRLAVDLSPLRSSRDFRYLWLGELISETGSQITLVAVFVQVFALTHSSAAVGAVGLVQLVPLALAALLGGPLIDRVDRRRLLLVAQCSQAGASALLLAGSLAGHPPLALVYVGAGLVGGFGGFSLSTRAAMTPNLVAEDQLSSALSLNQAMWNTCMIAGPALGGVLIAQLGVSWAYAVDVVSFAATITACILLHPQVPRDRPPRTRSLVATGWHELAEGVSFLRGKPVLQATFYVDLVAMIFGMPRALFPVLAVTRFGGGSEVVGLLFSSAAIGALLGALTGGWMRHVRRQGLAVLWAVFVWGLGIIAFGLSGPELGVAVACLAVAGAADVISAVFRGTILQSTTPDALRGRLSGIHTLVVAGGPRIGDFEAGVVASLTTPTVSVVSGGVFCVMGVGALAVLSPQFRRYRAGSDPPVEDVGG